MEKNMTRYFRLIGNTTVFRLVEEIQVLGFIPSVLGHTLDGRRQTVARVADITWLEGPL
jgi:hypothetical protein